MRYGLLLIDLQRDFLAQRELTPDSTTLIEAIAGLLESCRKLQIPIWHIHTLIDPDGGNRMPHWKANGLWRCVAGTAGAQPPPALAPLSGEAVLNKTFFSAFGNPQLQAQLRSQGVESLILAGVHTHGCIRGSALDAYQAGFEVLIASDAVGSYDPVHAAISIDYLHGRAARCLPSAEIIELLEAKPGRPQQASTVTTWLHRNPADWDQVLAEVPVADAPMVDEACAKAARVKTEWGAASPGERTDRMQLWLDLLTRRGEELIGSLMLQVGKPRRDAEAELRFALALLQHTLNALASVEIPGSSSFAVSYRPRGVVGLITPWNNPLAIPVGKLAPALGYGNTVVWKPAPQAHLVARLVMETLMAAGLDKYVELVSGGPATGRALVQHRELAAISFTGSIAVGEEIARISASNGSQLQAELGGNNAMIVLADADPDQVARELASAIFNFSGQRCTAPRRIIVEEALLPAFTEALTAQVRALAIGLPSSGDTFIGPVISRARQEKILHIAAQAVDAGGRLLCGGGIPSGWSQGCWLEPTLILQPPVDSLAVSEESFGPLAVLLCASDLEHALRLCNQTRYGLVAGIFTDDENSQRRFIAHAEAGILLINQGRPEFDSAAPFAGWKSSGLGIPEHGRWDRDFYTQTQTLYR